MVNDQNGLIYIFCITSEMPSVVNSWHDEGILSFEVDKLYVTMKYVSENDYSEINIKKNISNEAWLDYNARKHLQVIGDIMQRHTVIPFNFGTIYKSEESLRSFVSFYSADFMEVLLHLRNKEEWSVKVFCNRKMIVENIGTLSHNISDIDQQIKSSSPGKAYILGKKKKEIIETEIKVIYNTLSKRIFTAFNELCEEYRFNVILSSELSEKDEDMILNVAFFIIKENIEDFIKCSEKMTHEYSDIGMIFDITGPWPPYSFLNLLQ